ncbi:outer membrane beta-barrel protein [Ferrovibrio sp.]|uniref:outer membrane beta-barrel protein n=1 Tax=Ferrovibrio sp. TaxID=1917215 RepID=UPI0025B92950|nr:outer membrane beta-barrel protein [Ferrovibrio sp.]MBX3453997.1 porin family protein [Ferrovibrio sp.]
MRLLAVALVFSAVISAPVVAQEKAKTGWYGSITAGYLIPNDTDGSIGNTPVSLEIDNGYSIFGAAGYKFGNGFRVEGELGYSTADLDKVKIGSTPVTLNGDVQLFTATGGLFYDLTTKSAFTPYVGVGVGVVREELSRTRATANGVTVTTNGGSETNLTAFGEAGVGVSLGSKIELVPSYRYQWIDDGSGGLDDTTAHLFRLGLRYWF